MQCVVRRANRTAFAVTHQNGAVADAHEHLMQRMKLRSMCRPLDTTHALSLSLSTAPLTPERKAAGRRIKWINKYKYLAPVKAVHEHLRSVICKHYLIEWRENGDRCQSWQCKCACSISESVGESISA